MNIFVLDLDPQICAEYHCDKHIVKMILEYAQMLSSAHRTLDGYDKEDSFCGYHTKTKILIGEILVPQLKLTSSGKIKSDYLLLNQKAYKHMPQHQYHPCTLWVAESKQNYYWTYALLRHCLVEYTKRYGKKHSTENLMNFLKNAPLKIPNKGLTEFAQAMPDEYKNKDPVIAYRNFYKGSKSSFAKWTNVHIPPWYKE